MLFRTDRLRERAEGKAFFTSSFRSEIVSSSINERRCGGGGGGGRKTMLKISPNWNPRHYFSSPSVRTKFDSLAEEEEDDPNMAAQTEYKNARSTDFQTARVAAIRGSNQWSHTVVSGDFTWGCEKEIFSWKPRLFRCKYSPSLVRVSHKMSQKHRYIA